MARLKDSRGQISLTLAAVLAVVILGLLVAYSMRQRPGVSGTLSGAVGESGDGRETIVFWGDEDLGDEIYSVLFEFERLNPRYRVIYGSATSRNITSDGQRLLCAIAGNVPPDLVWFDRFAIGEWAGRGALTDLSPLLKGQRPQDGAVIDLAEYYAWAVNEASFAPPGSNATPGIYGIPTTSDLRLMFCNVDHLLAQGKFTVVDGQRVPRLPADWDELRLYAKELSRFDEKGRMTRLGFGPNYGESWLYLYKFQAGGSFLSADGTRATMDSPRVVRALTFMTDVYDDLGGYRQVSAFQQSFQSGALDSFVTGQVSLKIDGDAFMQTIAEWKPRMDFLLIPAPMPRDEIDAGRGPVTWSGGFCYAIPATAQNKDGAFTLIRYLTSWPVVSRMERAKREQRESEGKYYLPRGKGNRVQTEQLIREAVTGNENLPPAIRRAYKTVLEMLPQTRTRPVTPVGQLLWNQHIAAFDAATNHRYADRVKGNEAEARMALTEAQRPVQRALDEVMRPLPPVVVQWRPYFVAYALLLAGCVVAVWVVYGMRRKACAYKARDLWAAKLFVAPWAIGFALLVGGPIVFSIVLSFTRYDVLGDARYVGLANYAEVFSDPLFAKSLANTAFMILRIPLTMMAGLAIALLLNHAVRGMALYRAAVYLPAVMPVVAASLLWLWLFNPTFGALNQGISLVFRLLGIDAEPPAWLQDPAWSKPALILMSLWTAGGGMIIWLAGLQSIPQQLYEAASIDGAGPVGRFFHVTLPMLSPYIFFNFIMGIIGTLQIFNEAFIMTEGGPDSSTLFYAYHLFREAFQYFRMGYASALAWILFVIVLSLTLLQMWLSQRWVTYDRT